MTDPNSDDHPTEPERDVGTETGEETADSAGTVDSGTGYGDRSSDGRDPRAESTRVANEERRRNTAIVSAVVAAIGAWVALSVLVFDAGESSLWNNVLVGGVVFVAAGYNTYRIRSDVPTSIGITTLVAVLGIWLIVSSALFGMLESLFWSTLVSGLLIAGLSGYNTYEAREAQAIASGTKSGR
ncbi:hypothetical protein EA462_04740 [Natrarchaeobius halalkaliphilus]|uniref:SPW repeat-containing integral membrane domain-containing protein n=1 Tax=Natrarchaeobius halalkaliphilus TaxID=1679091 RepID=A0A3N6LPC9_9EURY|nr:hypothetical protein [Natrarchaeobius halalkaliphilus]RQG91298.1 hypothetical protein EA462_04740 [Natrarchaeobius halalkaliphilus]